MTRKIIPIVSVVFISLFAIFFLIESTSIDRESLEKTFAVDAIYYEEGYVEINYQDKSQKTNEVVLEILGMQDSFQKTFNESQFIERVNFASPPKYGWKTNPVTFVIEHEELGKIGIKIEIHSENEPPLPIIYSKL